MQISSVNIGPVTPGTNKIEGGGSAFQNVGIGESVAVEVVSAEGSSLTLRTPEGNLVKAEFPGAPVMQPGDQLQLMMSDKSSGTVHMRLTSVNGQTVNVGTGSLEVRMMDMGVEPSTMNTHAAQFLVERNVQPTPERIANLVKTATQFPEIPASMALFMVSNEIPATEQNVNTLMQWMNNGETLGAQAEELARTVTQMIAEQGVQEANVHTRQGMPAQSATAPFQSAFLETVAPKLANLPGGVLPQEGLAALADKLPGMDEGQARAAITEFVSQLPLNVNQKIALSHVLNSAFQSTNATIPEGQTLSSNTQAPAQANTPVLEQPAQPQVSIQQNASTQAQPNVQAQQQIQGQQSMPAQGQAVPAEGQNTQQAPAENQGQQPAQPQQVVQPGANQGQQAVPPDVSKGQPTIQQNTHQGQQMVQQNQQAPVTPDANAAVQEMQQVLQSLGKLVAPMKRDVAADAESLQNVLKNQQNTAESIHSSLAKIAGEANSATQKAADLSTRIQMGNNLENFYYCQVPFEIANQKQTAELYVFERHKGKSGVGGKINTTILIALETQNMARVETVLKAEEDSLNIEFRVQNDKVLQYLKNVSGELSEGLDESGFSVDHIRVVRMDTPATPLNVDQVLGEKEVFQLQAVDISV